MLTKLKSYTFAMLVIAAFRLVSTKLSIIVWTIHTKVLLRCLGCSYGKGLRVDGHVWIRVREKGAIRLGDHVTINSRFGSNLVGLNTPMVLECFEHGSIEIGDHSGCSGSIISSRSSIILGSHVKVGGNVRVFDHDFHALESELRMDPVNDFKNIRTVPVKVGDNAFIGTNAILLKGANVGASTIVPAGAVVTRKQAKKYE